MIKSSEKKIAFTSHTRCFECKKKRLKCRSKENSQSCIYCYNNNIICFRVKPCKLEDEYRKVIQENIDLKKELMFYKRNLKQRKLLDEELDSLINKIL
jgi:hypothetical protein